MSERRVWLQRIKICRNKLIFDVANAANLTAAQYCAIEQGGEVSQELKEAIAQYLDFPVEYWDNPPEIKLDPDTEKHQEMLKKLVDDALSSPFLPDKDDIDPNEWDEVYKE